LVRKFEDFCSLEIEIFMSGIIFDKAVFGPIKSRRLGNSLGINLLPTDCKICNFNCIYCECGWTEPKVSGKLTERNHLKTELRLALIDLKVKNFPLDSITFAGNGEPTIHPDFIGIVEDVTTLRNEFYPDAIVTVLSNSTTLSKPGIIEALLQTDNPVMKLDAGSEEIYQIINRSLVDVSLMKTVENLCKFEGKLIIQTLFLRGEYLGEKFDNTTEKEVKLWLQHIERIQPKYVMLYPIDRATPAKNLEKVSQEELAAIAAKVNALGIETKIYG
jgi:wyosine [tRNA(Phe)-imidazoG37] synthetase (radical SAM superfamily)